jgi:hypothetical protein
MENNSNYNRISVSNKTNKENKGNKKMILTKINTEKKQNLKYSKKASEKLISNLTDNKRNNYLNNIDFHESFSNSNIKRENLNYYYNYENDGNNFDISENYNSNKLIKDNSNKNSINNIFEKKFSDKLNISPYKKRFSTLTNNDMDENGSKNDEIIEQVISDKNDDNLYNNLIDFKNKNIILKNKIGILMKEIQKKNSLIKKLYAENEKNKKFIKKLINDKHLIVNINNKILSEKKNLENELFLIQNEEENHMSLNSKRRIKDNKYIEEIIKLKDELQKKEVENSKLKILLIKYKEKQYSNDASRTKLKKWNGDFSLKKRDIINYREYNKSVSVSKINDKINLDIPISKSYEEDKNIKSDVEKQLNIKIVKNEDNII